MSTLVAEGDASILGELSDQFDQVAATLFRELGDGKTDNFSVHLGSDPELGFFQGFAHRVDGGGIPRLDDKETGFGSGDASQLLEPHRRSVGLHAEILDQGGGGLACADSLEIFLHLVEGFFHFLLGFEEDVVGGHRMGAARSCSLALRAFAGTVLFFRFFEGGFHATQEVGGLGGIFQSVPLFFERFVRVSGGFDRKADATLRLVETNDAGFDFLAGFENIFDLGHTLLGDLGNVNEAVELSFELDEGAEAGDFADGSLDHLTDLEPSLHLFPRIFGELLESEGDSLVRLVDSEDLSFHRVSFFQNFGSVCRFACPRHIRNVDHAVDAFFELDKGAIGGGVANDSFHGATHRVSEMDFFPRVGLEVANGKGKLLLFLADADHDGIDFLTILQDVARAGDPACPGEFGNVDKAFHAGLELNEGTVRHETGDFATNLEIDRIFLGNLVPRILRHLFQSE